MDITIDGVIRVRIDILSCSKKLRNPVSPAIDRSIARSITSLRSSNRRHRWRSQSGTRNAALTKQISTEPIKETANPLTRQGLAVRSVVACGKTCVSNGAAQLQAARHVWDHPPGDGTGSKRPN